MIERRTGFPELVELVGRIDQRTQRIEAAIGGDPVLGAPGLQARVLRLEGDRGGRKLFRAMVTIGMAVGAAIGAALSPLVGGHK